MKTVKAIVSNATADAVERLAHLIGQSADEFVREAILMSIEGNLEANVEDVIGMDEADLAELQAARSA